MAKYNEKEAVVARLKKPEPKPDPKLKKEDKKDKKKQ